MTPDMRLSKPLDTERFVGDLNPEAVIREKLDVTAENHLRDRIGLWINPSAMQGDEGARNHASRVFPKRSPAVESQTVASFSQCRHMSVTRAFERLPLATQSRLIPIYFSKVNHILPLVDQKSFACAHAAGTTSVFLERAMCLVAAKDSAAHPHLRLAINGPLLSPRAFCSEIYNGLVFVMNDGLESDRITRIRALALMSLHCEGYEGAEAASMHICQAIHQAQTVGLHLDRPGRVSKDPLSDLFWCLWTLDKMHASIGGRPVLLADRDIGIKKPAWENLQARTAFDVWLAITELLSSVISLYRPTADPTVGWETGFPTFEETIGDNVRDDLDFDTLVGLLELFYHAVGILSCRYKPSERPDASKPSYTRQNLAAIRICSIAATECGRTLPPLPIVPYALALSMGVSYQQLRSSKLITHFDRARASLEACCSLLEDIGSCWYSAEAMARLGRKALHQIQEVRSDPGQRRRDLKSQAESQTDQPETSASCPSLPTHEGACCVGDAPPISSTPGPGDPSGANGAQSMVSGGFADIDILFGDFLDLSLPTNFWDPVFFSDTHTHT
ncbi:hypothetical protein P170DRAFT_381234 [Aspergillus steynii IBT 23096]|uniref:Xylanolytic transcriptional activator regulatory domain-containing protein n=1 Tax=Aspergillus steynii IBT 23096 TaxID=1392250 RepID=A0A2I2GC81_9EURO|nr:uncharacterized protein P170DRAFT_381234 [Aspergillus steynii IBT 23096]PLB50491.1 hypothetical protein P170DRAFT_381234 [Aspergillus steynii IBT 23096]